MKQIMLKEQAKIIARVINRKNLDVDDERQIFEYAQLKRKLENCHNEKTKQQQSKTEFVEEGEKKYRYF